MRKYLLALALLALIGVGILKAQVVGTQPVSGTVTADAGTGDFNNASIDATGTTVPASATFIAGSDGTNTVAVKLDAGGAVQIDCESGCGGGTSDTDDASVAGGQTTGLSIGLNYMWTGAAWERVVGATADGLLVDLGTNNDVTVTSGTITAVTDITNVVSVDDNGGNISVDWAGTVPPIGAGTEAAALRVTIATDSTGLVSIDDNGGSLTVDGTVSAAGNFTCGTTPVTAAFALIPDATPAAPSGFTSTTCLSAIVCANVTGVEHTLTVQDGQVTPVVLVNAAPIPGNTSVTFPLYGVPATTGIEWAADGASAIACAVAGWQ